MRNLRKYFAVFVAVAMLLTAMAPAFAADTAAAATMTDAKACETLGMLKGENGGVTDAYLKTSATRIQAAIMFLRLKGLEAKALAFTGKENFADASKVDWDGGKAILAYLKANKDLGWQGDGTNFNPSNLITAQEYYKILLVSLGYVEGTDFKYDETIKFAESKGLKAAAAAKTFTVNDVAIATVETLKTNVKAGGKTLLASLIADKVIDQKKADEAFAVAGPAAGDFALGLKSSAMTVTFGTAVADTAKVTITVTRDAGAIPVTLTTKWDTAKKVATLTSASKLVEGEYKVAIKDDAKDLGSKTAKVEKEKIGKIELLSDVLIRSSDILGKVSYKVTNQYAEDITNSTLSDNITWTSSVDGTTTVDGTTYSNGISDDIKAGRLSVTKQGGTLSQLKDQKIIVITGVDNDSGVSVSKSLTVSDTVGGIADIKLIGIKDKKVMTTGTTEPIYVEFEAKDAYGNVINDYDTFSNTDAFLLTSSSPSIVTAVVEQDPTNSKNAAIKLQNSTTNTGIAVIYAIAKSSGKTASLQVEVKEDQVVAQFQIQLPAADVAETEVVEIPYTAIDQDGKAITDYGTIMNRINAGKLTLTASEGSFQYQRAADGSFKLYFVAPTTNGSQVKVMLSATANTTTTVKMSTVNVDVKARAYPKTLSAVPAKFVANAVYKGTTDAKANDFTVLDQYGRKYTLRDGWQIGNDRYYIQATSTNTDVVVVHATNNKGINYAAKIVLTAGPTKGSAAVKYELMKITWNGTAWSTPAVVDSKNGTWTTVDTKDITSYTVAATTVLNYADRTLTTSKMTYNGAYSNPTLFSAGNTPITGLTPAIAEYRRDFNTIRGKLANGSEVLLDVTATGMVLNRAITDEGDRFIILPTDGNKSFAFNNTKNKDEDEFTGKVLVTILGYNNIVYTPSCEIKASRKEPVAASSAIAIADPITGVANVTLTAFSYDMYRMAKQVGDTYEVELRNIGQVINPYATVPTSAKFLSSFSTLDGTNTNKGKAVVFTFPDQYGKSVLAPSFMTATVKNAAGTDVTATKLGDSSITTIDAATNGWALYLASGQTAEVGDEYTITVVSDNGITKTITVKVIANKTGNP